MSRGELIFIGGVDSKNKWLDNGKTYSRNYRQGDRVYSSEGMATALTSQPVGGTGGFSTLYLVSEHETEEEDTMKNSQENTNKLSNKSQKVDFKYVSLFSGIGGFERALDSLGGECVFASEIDKFASQAYKVLYGDDVLHGDITEIDEKDIPEHDLLVGGFPCQSFSVAGKRLGFDDARGSMFFEIARIAKEKQPRVLLLENVKGLVGHDKGKTLDTMVKILNETGYVVDFEVLNSKFFDVPQNRERIFIVAVREDIVEQESWSVKGTTVVPRGKRRISGYEDEDAWELKTFNFDYPDNNTVNTRLRDVLEPYVDEKYYLSEEKTEALVSQLNDKDVDDVPSVIHNIYGGFSEKKPRIFKGQSPTIRTSAGGGHLPSIIEHNKENDDEPKANSVGNVNPSGRGMNGQVYDIESGLSPTLTTNKGEGVKMLEEVRPVLTPERVEKRQNGRRFKGDDEEAFTVTTQDRHGVAIGASSRYRIRKLTPLECFRLQSFSDEAHQALVDAGISDSQRYKMAGNAVTVNVVRAIGERLLKYLE